MSPPGTFERVYAALKERLRLGAFRPGERLEPAVLSDEMFASVTPIRDALHRLAGERLVEAPRHEGFRVPSLSETRLRHLYAWHRDLLLLAIRSRHWSTPSDGPELSESANNQEPLSSVFSALARSSGNPELAFAMESVRERLEPLERLEHMLLEEIEIESEAILEALHSGDSRRLRGQLLRYHRRRERIVPELLERLQHS